MAYPELSTWQGIANFISDHTLFQPLQEPTKQVRGMHNQEWMNKPTFLIDTNLNDKALQLNIIVTENSLIFNNQLRAKTTQVVRD